MIWLAIYLGIGLAPAVMTFIGLCVADGGRADQASLAAIAVLFLWGPALAIGLLYWAWASGCMLLSSLRGGQRGPGG